MRAPETPKPETRSGDPGLLENDQLGERIKSVNTTTVDAAQDRAAAKPGQNVQNGQVSFDLLWPRDIKVGDRHRKDYGDLEALARSINERGGLIHPIAVTPTKELIAGERRLKAWQLPVCRFRDQPIPITVIDIDSIIAGEQDENDPALRKNFTPSEAVAIARALRPRLEFAAKERQREGGRSKASGNLPEASKGETREQVAKATGKGARTLEKAEAIVAAAEAEPDKYGKLVEDIDRTGNVNGPYKRLRNMQAVAMILAEPPPLPMNGPYRTGIIDVPWCSEPGEADKDHGARGYHPYPTMTPEQVAAMPVLSILHEDASVWLWIPNFHLMHGHHLTTAKAWGLKPVALLTWVKHKFGQGQRARGATEHVIQMIRGNVACLGSDTKTWFLGDCGAHSQKPREFYEIVEKLTPAARYFELFSRSGTRENWDLHGNEIGKLAIPVAAVVAAHEVSEEEDADQEAETKARKVRTPTVVSHKTNMADAVSGAFSEITDLAEEYRQIVDNATEGLSETQRVQTFGETADTLEGLQEPDVPSVIATIEVNYTITLPKRKDRGLSRAARMSDAIGILDACMEALDRVAETDVRHQAACDLFGELDAVKAEAEGCEFPGMYG
jgi:N6-adenosine-specific RNA methylase IME4